MIITACSSPAHGQIAKMDLVISMTAVAFGARGSYVTDAVTERVSTGPGGRAPSTKLCALASLWTSYTSTGPDRAKSIEDRRPSTQLLGGCWVGFGLELICASVCGLAAS